MLTKTMRKTAVLIFVMSMGVSAQAQELFNFYKDGHVKTWNEAREKCQQIGKNWDLPLPGQAALILQKELATTLDYYELGEGTLQRDYVMWVRAENEEHNVQLQDRSLALRYNPQTTEVLEFDLSQKSFEELGMLQRELRLIPAQQIRTQDEQKKYEDAVQAFEARYPFAGIPFDLYQAYSIEHPLLASLPSDIFTLEVIGIMLKFSSEYIEVISQNIDIILQHFAEGLEVVCISTRTQGPSLGGMKAL